MIEQIVRTLEEIRRRLAFAIAQLEGGNHEAAAREIDSAGDALHDLNEELR